MTEIECPSKWWDRHVDDEERASFPSKEEALDSLDPMGDDASQYSFSLSIPGDDDYESDTTIYTDFTVFEDEAGTIFIAYVVVFDGPGYCAATDSGVFDSGDLGDLDKNKWFPAESQVDGVNEAAIDTEPGASIQWEEVEKAQKKWTENLIDQIRTMIKAQEDVPNAKQ